MINNLTHSNRDNATEERNVKPLVFLMTVMAWLTLGIGVVLCLLNLHYFSDQNLQLMIGIGFLVGSVQIYVIRTAIHLVNNRASSSKKQT
ncbi:hypothetical protein ACFOQM_20945 [Paenibacillus sp. GCM10012307]|uniref:Uncharacterized protein n=1 Tax=Paenibacillus roseus TaxID=2798579 RepID=A0A934JAY0_9BACL|nr:hypothetical protein [Paenibacillus roseus]MBJ6363697.1 hypothetical protein [Paenibacillus roseus]